MSNIMAAVAYLFGWLSGLIVYFISKEDPVARFHGIQAILVSVVYGVILGIFVALGGIIVAVGGIIGQAFIGLVVGGIVMVISLLLFGLLMLWTMWQAFNNKMYKLPLIGGLAEKWSA